MSLYSSLTQVLAPFAAKINGLLTGWDGTKYSTPGEAVRTQISDLHVLIGDIQGDAKISGSAVGYDGTESGLSATTMQGAIDEVSGDVANVNGRLREQEKHVYSDGVTVDVSIQNGTIVNASNKDCVCTSHIPCVNGKSVTIFPVREAPTGCKYRFAYRIYDSDGNVLKANESPFSEDLQTAYIGYINAASIRFVINLYDMVNEKSVSLRADTYGALPYAVVYSDTVKNMSEDVAFAMNAIEKPMVFVNGKTIYLTSGGELTISSSTVDMSTLPAPCDSGETMYVVPNKNFKVTLFVRVNGVWSVAVLSAESKFSFTFTDEEVYLLRGEKIVGTVVESEIPFKVYATIGTELNKITSRIDSGGDWRVGGPALEDEVNRYISNGRIATSTAPYRASIPPFVPPSRTLRFEMMGDNKYALFVNVGGTWSVLVDGTKTQTINLDSDVEQICIQFTKSPIKNFIVDSVIQTKVLFDYSAASEDNDYSDVIRTEDISDTISWSIGGIGSDGADWSRPYAIRSTYIPVVKTISLDADYVAWCSFYDENHNFIIRIQNLKGDSAVKDVYSGEYTYLRLEVKYAPNDTDDTTPITDTSRSEHVRLYKTAVDVDAESVWTKYDHKRYEDLISQSKYAYNSNSRVLTLLHFSDIHGDFTGMKFALNVYDSLSHKIDDIIHTGDTVIANYSDGISNWIQSGCADRVLNVIGNHDTEENLVLQAAGKDNVYNTFFAPYISNWDVVQPANVDTSGSADYHALYYYKDYDTPKIRLIVLDTNFWDSAQSAWLTGTLASAKEDGYAVILACHNVKKLTEMTDSNFSSYNGDGIAENTNSYANQPDNWLDPVADFMDAGGEFICMLAGHDHDVHMGYLTLYPDIFCYVSDKGSVARTSGAARISGENNANTVNIVTVNATEKLFKIVKIGAEVDGKMRGRHVFCYDYANKRIVSQW
jgi:hypothetical protein